MTSFANSLNIGVIMFYFWNEILTHIYFCLCPHPHPYKKCVNVALSDVSPIRVSSIRHRIQLWSLVFVCMYPSLICRLFRIFIIFFKDAMCTMMKTLVSSLVRHGFWFFPYFVVFACLHPKCRIQLEPSPVFRVC